MSFANQATDQKRAAATDNKIAALVPLLREIGNLKRIRAANLRDSFAAGLFARAWSATADGAGENHRAVAVEIAKDAVIAASLGAIDADVLRSAELDDAAIETILRRAFEAVAAPIDVKLHDEMSGRIGKQINYNVDVIPPFVELLRNQPRSGATKTGAPKMIFDAPENHAEHSIIVAVYAVLLAPFFDADAETAFTAALAHHFHNAYLPDSGFAGEEALGEFLPVIFEAFRRKCFAQIPDKLHDKIQNALEVIETADAPEAKAFHAADIIDRVLQMRHHAEQNEFTLRYAMEEAELVHAGAIQDFHFEVLRAARLFEQ